MSSKSHPVIKFVQDNKAGIFYTGIALIGLYYAYNGVKMIWGNEDEGSGSGFDQTGNNVNISNATIDNITAQNYAYSLFNAMRSSGTNEELIEATFNKIKNKDDFLLVYKAFGEKYYDTLLGYYLVPSWNNKLFADKYDLVFWLDSELGLFNGDLRAKISPVINAAGFAFTN